MEEANVGYGSEKLFDCMYVVSKFVLNRNKFAEPTIDQIK
jgi:hypothetical protein